MAGQPQEVAHLLAHGVNVSLALGQDLVVWVHSHSKAGVGLQWAGAVAC